MNSSYQSQAGLTRPVDPRGSSPSQRSLLLVYHGVAPQQHSTFVEVPEGSEITFGRSRKSTVHIDVEGVSRNHCILRRQGERYQVEDLKSRNGTRVNGELIHHITPLQSGDEISIGPMRAVLSISRTSVSKRRLGNTALLDERLLAECDRGKRYSRPFSLVMLEIGGDPKLVDQALEHISGQLRPMDTMCEYAPTTFALVVPEATKTAAQSLARRLAEVLEKDCSSNLESLRCGLATFPKNGTNGDKLLAEAQAALQRSIREGAAITEPPEQRRENSVIVSDPQMARVFELVKKVAPSEISVLILGETGAGKEIIANSIHKSSKRSDKPYVRLNCASIPETLLESELFGHEKGAFTGALATKIGYFEAADKGTIFLDEIGEVSANVQAKLLRVLENRCIVRVGGICEIEVDVRILYATNRDLESEVVAGRFREDLFYRIGAFSILVPSLRDRPKDILPLCEYFLEQSATKNYQTTPLLSEPAKSQLQGYSWPGNVRQLRNAMERAVVLAKEGLVEVSDLPDRVRVIEDSSSLIIDGEIDLRDQLAVVEKASIVAALEASKGNQTKAAKQLGMSRRAFIYKMEKHGLKDAPLSAQS